MKSILEREKEKDKDEELKTAADRLQNLVEGYHNLNYSKFPTASDPDRQMARTVLNSNPSLSLAKNTVNNISTLSPLQRELALNDPSLHTVAPNTAVSADQPTDPLDEARKLWNQTVGLGHLPEGFAIDIPGFEAESAQKIAEAEKGGQITNEEKKEILDETAKDYIPEWTPSSTTDDGVDTKSEMYPGNISDDAIDYIKRRYDELASQRSQTSNKLDSLITDYINRKDFNYDPNSDMLYQNYLAAMQNAGQMAMKDTMGQAAMLTGGYGSTYATAAANGAYNNYLQKANEALPDYYNMAANAYDRQGEDMLSKIKLLQNKEEDEYNKLLDLYNTATGNVSSGSKTSSASSGMDTMTAAQENAVMSSALQTWLDSNGNEAEVDKLLDGMTGYNFSEDFVKSVKDYIKKHSSTITLVKRDNWLRENDVYTDGVNTFTYKDMIKQWGDDLTKEQQKKIRDLAVGKSYTF